MRKALGRPWVGVRVCHLILLFVNSFQFQRTKTFRAVFEKVHLAGVQRNRDGNLCMVKSVQKLMD